MALFFITAVADLKAQSNPAQDISSRIANKMRDTLSLFSAQRDSIYSINIELHNRKQLVRQQYSNMDSLRIKIQAIENTRDSLYRTVLSEEKYLMYRQKKRNLVSNN